MVQDGHTGILSTVNTALLTASGHGRQIQLIQLLCSWCGGSRPRQSRDSAELPPASEPLEHSDSTAKC